MLNAGTKLDSDETAAALLGLSDGPCGPERSKRFFFETPLISQQLAILNRLISSSKVILVMGERGSGKSTMVRQIVSALPGKWVSGRLSVKTRSKKNRLPAGGLNRIAVFYTKQRAIPSMILDNAHQLAQKELELLIRKAFSKGPNQFLRSIVLFGEPELRQHLKAATTGLPPETVIEKINLSPFSEQETVDYLTHRVRKAALLDRLPFQKNS